jgi:hypothetical protein
VTFSKRSLRDRVLSDENIYLAIYSVNSYIFNKELLSEDDKKDLILLNDKFNQSYIIKWIKKIRNRISELLENDCKYLEVDVYFNPKKYNKDSGIEFRPLHSAKLIEQITSVAMLNVLVYEVDDKKKLSMSNLSRLIPHNFYGNKISESPEILYKPWTEQYKMYTSLANDLFAEYNKSHEYKFEVNLDLKNFFPSINTIALYQYVCNKMPVNYIEEDEKIFKKIVEKLIFSVVQNLVNEDDKKRYYKECLEIDKIDQTFVMGISQGMPQAYFFANLCMIEIEKAYDQVFKGKNLFYVDDSIIFTNIINQDGKNFKARIQNINFIINNWIKSLLIYKSELPKVLIEFTNIMSYELFVYEEGEKSTYSKIKTNNEINEGEQYLKSISRETSKTAFDMNTSYSDEESIILKNKINIILNALENEILRVTRETGDENNKSNKTKSYLKKLIRYKKFFKYRQTEMKYREDNNIEAVREGLLNDLSFLSSNNLKSGLLLFFEKYNDDILGATINFVFRNSLDPVEDNKKLIEKVSDLNKCLFTYDNTHSSYLYKAYEQYIRGLKIEYEEISEYKSLLSLVKQQLPIFKRKSESFVKKTMNNKLEEILEKNEVQFGISFKKNYKSVMGLVNENTDEIRRKILNTIFSYGYQIELNDTFEISNSTNCKITYKELRLLCYLRNKNFCYSDFVGKIPDFLNTEYDTGIDYSVLQVLKIFKTFVTTPGWIDNLILVHKYTSDIWKNGSKYLHFYTLHNQEHAVELIHNSLKIIRAINFLQISNSDFYILFMACYLHDISMVTLPELKKFQEDRFDTNRIASDFVYDIKGCILEDTKSVKKIMKDFYKRLDTFYESEVRNNHSKDSGKEIRNRDELNFIEDCLREIVAEVAEAHGQDTNEVYQKKSDAHNKLMSKKFTQIILRIADLLDMSNYRVSKTILNHNMDNMSNISAFHWLSHLLTEGYEILTDYCFSGDGVKAEKSFLAKQSITEKICLKIYINLSQLSKESIKSKCKNVCLYKIDRNLLMLKCGSECTQSSCNFLCKWFANKNDYLFLELQALTNYLNSNKSNYYRSEIEVQLVINERTKLSEQQFSVITDYLKNY